MASGTLEGGIIPKLGAAVTAARHGVPAFIGQNGGPSAMSVFTGTPLLPTYARFPVDVRRGRRRVADRRRRAALPRPLRRHRRGQARPPPPRPARRRTRPARPALARLEPLFHRADAGARSAAVRAVRRRPRVLLQLRRRVGRGGAQVGAQGDREDEIVALEGSFHGRTMGALSITGQPAKRAPSSRSCPASGSRRPRRSPTSRPQTAAILLEPVQGEGGVHPLATETLEKARALADEHGAMLDVRRGADRRRAHRRVLRLAAARRTARRGHAREGPRERPADRGAARLRRGAHGLRARRPCLHLRREPGGVRGGVRRRRHDRRRPARPRPGCRRALRGAAPRRRAAPGCCSRSSSTGPPALSRSRARANGLVGTAGERRCGSPRRSRSPPRRRPRVDLLRETLR